MELLKRRIREDGQVLPGNVLKVNSFLNHQIDVGLLEEIGKEFSRRFSDVKVNKILTVEASGIGIACIAARYFGCCPVVFAKKTRATNIGAETYTVKIPSFTHGTVSDVIVDKKFLGPDDRVLLLDDFLANGKALEGLREIVAQAGGTVVGMGVVIEKGFQGAGDRFRAEGARLESLAIVDRMDPDTGEIVFR